eukprot:scaffold20671_cov49-Attheya_sp.AAC.3
MQTLSPAITFDYDIDDMTIESISNNATERSDSNGGRRHQRAASEKLRHRDLFFLLYYGESRNGA